MLGFNCNVTAVFKERFEFGCFSASILPLYGMRIISLLKSATSTSNLKYLHVSWIF
jgi:hypothetical protein